MVDLSYILRDLREQRDALAAAIDRLESIAKCGRKRRGRPPNYLKGIGQMRQSQGVSAVRHSVMIATSQTVDNVTAGLVLGRRRELGSAALRQDAVSAM